MVRLADELAGAHGATLFLVDRATLRPYVVYNLPKGYIAGIGTARVGTRCCGRAVAQKRPWIVSRHADGPTVCGWTQRSSRRRDSSCFFGPCAQRRSCHCITRLPLHGATLTLSDRYRAQRSFCEADQHCPARSRGNAPSQSRTLYGRIWSLLLLALRAAIRPTG